MYMIQFKHDVMYVDEDFLTLLTLSLYIALLQDVSSNNGFFKFDKL